MEPSNKVLLNIIDHNKLIRKNPLKNIEIAFASNFCNLTLCQMRTYQSIAHKEELTLCNSVPFTSRTANSICNGIRNIAVQAKSECKDEDFVDTQTRQLFRVSKFEKITLVSWNTNVEEDFRVCVNIFGNYRAVNYITSLSCNLLNRNLSAVCDWRSLFFLTSSKNKKFFLNILSLLFFRSMTYTIVVFNNKIKKKPSIVRLLLLLLLLLLLQLLQ